MNMDAPEFFQKLIYYGKLTDEEIEQKFPNQPDKMLEEMLERDIWQGISKNMVEQLAELAKGHEDDERKTDVI